MLDPLVRMHTHRYTYTRVQTQTSLHKFPLETWSPHKLPLSVNLRDENESGMEHSRTYPAHQVPTQLFEKQLAGSQTLVESSDGPLQVLPLQPCSVNNQLPALLPGPAGQGLGPWHFTRVRGERDGLVQQKDLEVPLRLGST